MKMRRQGRIFLASGLRLMALLLLSLSWRMTAAQELLCTVEVNSSSIEGTYKSAFETLRESISDYMNETKWTDAVFAPNERIECRMFLTVKEYNGSRVSGDLQVQVMRPVFNSSYTTTLLNLKDNFIEFDYREGDPLVFNENVWRDNLTGILDYYAYLFLALDFDSFSPRGGQPFFDKASAVVQMAQSSGESGWRMYDNNENRATVLTSFTDSNTGKMRDLSYHYHRKGLDEMASGVDKGRAAITESLDILNDVYGISPMSVALPIFRDAKLHELVGIYSKAPESEREKVYELLSHIYPADMNTLEEIRRPELKK